MRSLLCLLLAFAQVTSACSAGRGADIHDGQALDNVDTSTTAPVVPAATPGATPTPAAALPPARAQNPTASPDVAHIEPAVFAFDERVDPSIDWDQFLLEQWQRYTQIQGTTGKLTQAELWDAAALYCSPRERRVSLQLIEELEQVEEIFTAMAYGFFSANDGCQHYERVPFPGQALDASSWDSAVRARFDRSIGWASFADFESAATQICDQDATWIDISLEPRRFSDSREAELAGIAAFGDCTLLTGRLGNSTSELPTTGLLFASTQDGDDELFIYDSEGVVHQLTYNDSADWYASWDRSSGLITATISTDQDDDVYVIDPRSGAPIGLSAGSLSESRPYASPNGAHIAWQVPGGSFDDIHVLDTATGTTAIIAANDIEFKMRFYDNGTPWSPTGDRLAFLGRWGDRIVGASNLYLGDRTGGEAHQLTDFEEVSGFSWSPDGSEIVVSAKDWDRADDALYIVTVATGEVRELPVESEEAFYPQWSPDGEWIAFVEPGEQTRHLSVVNGAGDEQRRLVTADEGENIFWHVWSPDSRSLAFTTEDPRTAITGEYREPNEPIYTVNLNGDVRSLPIAGRPQGWR